MQTIKLGRRAKQQVSNHRLSLFCARCGHRVFHLNSATSANAAPAAMIARQRPRCGAAFAVGKPVRTRRAEYELTRPWGEGLILP
jgi:hypothetical protein